MGRLMSSLKIPMIIERKNFGRPRSNVIIAPNLFNGAFSLFVRVTRPPNFML